MVNRKELDLINTSLQMYREAAQATPDVKYDGLVCPICGDPSVVCMGRTWCIRYG